MNASASRAVADRVERGEGERGVPEPHEAVVPVPHAADGLGQRGGGRGDDRPGLRVGQQLERQRRALDHAAERPAVAHARRPARPERGGDVELARALVAVDRVDVVVVVAEDHPALLALLQREAGGGGGLLDDPLERLGAGEREDLIGAVGGEQAVPQQLEPGGAGPVLEAGHEDHLHRHPAAGAADLAVDLRMGAGRAAVLVHRHEVGQDDDAVRRSERWSRGCWCGGDSAGWRSTRPRAGRTRCRRAPGREWRRRRCRCRSAAGSTSRWRRPARPAPRCACRRSGRTRRASAWGPGRAADGATSAGESMLEVRHRPSITTTPEGSCMRPRHPLTFLHLFLR